MDRVLHQFPISHYCEKARWVLDCKGLPYRVRNQFPGLHARENRRLTGSATVPVLVERGRAIGGSHAIALHLDHCSDEPRLVPMSADARSQLDATVTYFDDVVGPAVRRYAYSLILPRLDQFNSLFFAGYSALPRIVGQRIAQPITRKIASMYRVDAPEVRELPDLIHTAADRVAAQLAGGRYLLEDRFSLADITVASLLGPLVGPAGSPWTHEPDIAELQTLRRELRAHPAGRYVTDLYSRRHIPAAR